MCRKEAADPATGRHFSDISRSQKWRQGYYSRKRKTNEAIEKDTYIQVFVNCPSRKLAKKKARTNVYKLRRILLLFGHYRVFPIQKELLFYFS
jgi:hypothetical protein